MSSKAPRVERRVFGKGSKAVNAFIKFGSHHTAHLYDEYQHEQWLKCKIRGGGTLHSGLGH